MGLRALFEKFGVFHSGGVVGHSREEVCAGIIARDLATVPFTVVTRLEGDKDAAFGVALVRCGLTPNEAREALGMADPVGILSCEEIKPCDPSRQGADRACRECGCTYYTPCLDARHGACWWVSADLCSACSQGWGKADA